MNDKVKSLFFSQYYGQRIWYIGLMHPQLINGYSLLKYDKIEDSYLLLRDISQLTDEEFKIVGKMCNYKNGPTAKRTVISMVECFGISVQGAPLQCYQYLLRIGILLPFTYLSETNQPITLTPAEIIALGWATLKSNEQ